MSKRIPLAQIAGKQILDMARNLPEGTRKLPSEEELCRTLDVSRATLREALSLLDRAGFITKRHGVGNMVNPSVLEVAMRFDAEQNLRQMLESGGARVATRRCQPEVDGDIPFDTAQISLPHPWIVQRTEHEMDGKPAVLTFNIFSRKKGDLCVEETERLSFRELIGLMAGEELSHTVTAFGACAVQGQVASFLGLPGSYPVVFWHQKHYGREDGLLCESIVYFNPMLVKLHSFNRWS